MLRVYPVDVGADMTEFIQISYISHRFFRGPRYAKARTWETVKLSAFHRRISIPPDGGFDVRTGQVTAKEGMMW